MYDSFVKFAVSNSIDMPTEASKQKSKPFIKQQIKALIARQIWRDQGYYTVIQRDDKAIQMALQKLQTNQALLNGSN